MGLSIENAKKIAAEAAVDLIENGMVIGLGTGSTAFFAIDKIGKRIKEGLTIQAIATSKQTELLAIERGIPLTSFSQIDSIDLTIDGADEVDSYFNLIKGGGGALLREKIVASSSKQFVIVVDESKLVSQLGKFLLPVEVIPFGVEIIIRKLQKLDCKPNLRIVQNKYFITDNGNYIIDCDFKNIESPEQLHHHINSIIGVVDNGLFIHMASKVIIGYENQTVKILSR